VPGPHQAAADIGAHPPQADNSDLHVFNSAAFKGPGSRIRTEYAPACPMGKRNVPTTVSGAKKRVKMVALAPRAGQFALNCQTRLQGTVFPHG
jgi:hypothetical protein